MASAARAVRSKTVSSLEAAKCTVELAHHYKNAFDTLYEEGVEGSPKMLTIGARPLLARDDVHKAADSATLSAHWQARPLPGH
jgi:hypothetical protein